MAPSVSLVDAITAVEQSQTAYSNAAAQTANDQSAVAAIQTKLDAANAQVAMDQQAQSTAAQAFNSALDILIASAQAAKIAQ
jgi:hypothetical protein